MKAERKRGFFLPKSKQTDQEKGFVEMLAAKSLLKRRGTSDEVARAARFLLSEDSTNITGTELLIDGGVRLN
jgi:NAD(P)-dependent dehydrogenase (short-subunit alcohol dehydrogenase family)